MAFDLKKIEAKLAHVSDEFRGKQAQMGFPKDAFYEDGTQVAYVATIQNFGAPARGIPPRPFMEPTVAEHKAEWVKQLAGGVKKVSDGGLTAFDVLDGVGRLAVADIQATIAGITEPELSAATVLLRKWRKEGRTITGATVGEAASAIAAGEDPGSDNKPLNATGYMIASVRNAVNKTGEEM